MKDSTDTEQKVLAKPANSQKSLSAEGKAAIQGENDLASNLENLQDSQKQLRLTASSQKADNLVPKRGDGDFAQVAEFYEVSGRVGEELAKINTSKAVNLNDFLGKSNIPNYDISSPEDLASVKVMRTKDGKPRYSTYNAHFREMVSPKSHKNQLFAKELSNLGATDPLKWKELSQHLPPDVAKANDTVQYAKSSAENSILRISQEQIQKVRDNLIPRIQQDPQSYGLEKSITIEEIDLFVKKHIQSFDPVITANDIDITTVSSMNRRHGKKSLWK